MSRVAEVTATQLIRWMAKEQHLVTVWLGEGARKVKEHETMLLVPAARAYRAVLDMPLRDLPLTRALFLLRGIAHQRDMTVRQLFTTPPFRLLEEQEPVEIVFEISRRRFRSVLNFRFDSSGSSTRVSTATWVETWDWLARATFTIYWLFVGPFSGMIRKELLRVAQRRARQIRAG
jgi:hypothetical protein